MRPLWPVCFSSLVLSSASPELFFLILFHFCAWSRGACYPFDIFSAWLMLARLWNRSSCNWALPSRSPVLLLCSLCAPREASLLQLQPARSLCNLPPVTLTHRRVKVLIHCLMGSALAPASLSISSLRPQLNKALEWSLLSCCSLPPCQHDRKCPCRTDGCFLKRCQQYQADLVALIFPIHGEYSKYLLKVITLVAEVFFSFFFLPFTSTFLYDGERILFPHCQNKCNILGREKNFPLLSWVIETSLKVSTIYSFYHCGDFPLSHHLGGAGQLCLGFDPKMSLIWKTVLETSLEQPFLWDLCFLLGWQCCWIQWDFPCGGQDTVCLFSISSLRLLLSRGETCEEPHST